VNGFEVMQTEESLWTVGFPRPDREVGERGRWEPVSDHGDEDEADRHCELLNGNADDPCVYLRSEPGLWTVGYFADYRWEPLSDHGSAAEAEREVIKLNA